VLQPGQIWGVGYSGWTKAVNVSCNAFDSDCVYGIFIDAQTLYTLTVSGRARDGTPTPIAALDPVRRVDPSAAGAVGPSEPAGSSYELPSLPAREP
jgi:hypothetical protein